MNRECSLQEAVYDILPKLKIRRIFPAVYFVNTNLLQERVQVSFLKKELTSLRDDSQNNFKRSNIDCYIERSSATLCN